MSKEVNLPVIVIDSSYAFLDQLQSESAQSPNPPILVQTVEEARKYLSQADLKFSAIFINSKITEFGGLPMIRLAILKHPSTPLFLIKDGETQGQTSPDFLAIENLPISKVLRKPIRYPEIQRLLMPIIESFDIESALQKSRETTLDVGPGGEITYTPTLISNFISGDRSFFDLYIRLPRGRYVKLLSAGDSLSTEQLSGYIKKGVFQLYLRRDAQGAYLKFCDHVTTKLMSLKSVPKHIKQSQTLNLGHETINFLQCRGVGADYIHHAASYLSHIHTVAEELKLEDQNEIRVFLNDLSAYQHGVATSAVAAIFMRALKIESPQLQKIIGMASLMHDIGLLRIPNHLLPDTEDESKMSPDQLEVYRSHSLLGMQVLEQSGKIHESVIQAVGHHHHRRDGSGFPKSLPTGQLSQVAEIVGICDELVHHAVQARTDPWHDPVEELLATGQDRFSIAIFNAFRTIFSNRV